LAISEQGVRDPCADRTHVVTANKFGHSPRTYCRAFVTCVTAPGESACCHGSKEDCS
jgi:hypothetical protein